MTVVMIALHDRLTKSFRQLFRLIENATITCYV